MIVWMLAGFLSFTGLGLALMIRAMKQTLEEDGQGELYRWGLFYVNAEDARTWVPKRLGLGWTLNFAHGLSWFILILLLLPVALIIGFTRSH